MALRLLMILFSIFFVCYADFILNNGRNSDTHFETIHTFEQDSCSHVQFMLSMKESIKKNRCQPKETVVHLQSNNLNIQITPDRVAVKRCYEAGCYGKKSCMPVKMKQIEKAIHYTNRLTNQVKCGWINVTEHEKCACKCNTTKQECELQNKIFNQSHCSCVCKNEKLRKEECQKQQGMKWDEETCTCNCVREMMDCGTGTEWVPRLCSCMRVMM